MKLLFLESICDIPEVIAANVELKVSMGDPDYQHMSREEARADFLRRIKQYEDSYQPVDEDHLSYLKVINVGEQVTANHIRGYLQSRIAYYLMNLHLKPRSIYFSRVSMLDSTCGRLQLITDCSTGKVSTMWTVKLAVMRLFRLGGPSMPTLFPP